jgi:hypothetical protein
MAGLGDMSLAKAKADTEAAEAREAAKPKEPGFFEKVLTSKAKVSDIVPALTLIGGSDKPPRPKMSDHILPSGKKPKTTF